MQKKLLCCVFGILLSVGGGLLLSGQETSYPYRIARTLEHNGWGQVKYLAWTPDGKYLISASRQAVNTWDASSWKLERLRSVAYPDESIHSLAASPDGQCYALAVHDEILVVNIRSGGFVARQEPLLLDKGTGFIESLIWTTREIISGTLNYEVSGSVGEADINISVGESCSAMQGALGGAIPNVRKRVTALFSHRDRLYVGGIGSTNLLIYRINSREGYPLERTVELRAATEGFTASPFNPEAVLAHILHEHADGGRIIEVEAGGGVRDIWSWASGKAEDEVTYTEWATNAVYALASRADGSAIFTTGTGILYALKGPNRAEVLYRHSQQRDLDVDFIVLAPHPTDPNIIAYAPGDGKIYILEK